MDETKYDSASLDNTLRDMYNSSNHTIGKSNIIIIIIIIAFTTDVILSDIILHLLCQLACVRYLCTAQILKVVGKSGKLINNH